MSFKIKSVFAFIVFYLTTTIYVFSADISSTAIGGDWSLTTSWVGGIVPTASDNVTIASGATVTIDQDVSIIDLIVNGNLVIGNDATSRSLTITGTTTVAATGSITVGAFDITHNILLQGDLVNNGTLNFFNTASQTANVVFDGTLTVGGANTPIFAKVIFNLGTITAAVSFDIRGAVVIEDATTFNDGNLTHTVAGNWTENGTGQLVGNGTIEMQASLIQSITSPATFYNLTFNGGGIGVIGASVNVSNNFLVDLNTEVNSSQYNNFQGDFTVTDGSIYEATAGRATFNSANAQIITIGTSNVIFNELYFDNGNAANPKTISGDILAKSITYIYDDAVVNDGGNNHYLNGLRLDGVCNFSGTITATGGTFYDDGGDGDFTLGTADLIAEFLHVGSNDVMHVNGNVTVGKEDNTDYNYLVISDGSQLVGQAGNTLLIKNSKYLYIQGLSNFPTGFGTITFAEGAFARYDGNIDQTINSSVAYWHLYLNNKIKTASGDLDINGNLYLYSAVDFQMGAFNHTIAGSIVNTDDSYGNGSLTSTGTVTLDAPDANQYIYDAGSGTYTFNDLILTNTAPSTARGKYFRNNIVVNGNFTVTNSGGDNVKRLYIDIDDHTITGGNNFNLGANVSLLTSGVNSFQTTITSFSGTKTFDLNSTVRFDRTDNGSNQNIPGGVIYGNIELYGSNNKIPQSNLDINGNLSSVGYTPVFTDNSHQINIAGNWNLSYITTNLTGTNTVVFDGIDQEISQSEFSYVYFSNSGTKNIIGNLDILKNLTIQAGVVVETERSINIEGNWIEQTTGEFHQTGGIVTFDGISSNQTVTANNNSYFYNFYIDKKAASKLVTLNSDIDINGTFNFVEDNASFDMNHYNIYVAGNLYFREGCSFAYNGGTAYFDGNDIAQIIYNNSSNTMIFGNAEFSGTAVKRLYGNIYKFEGNVTILNTTLDGQWWDIFVEGDWINNGIFRHSATLHFNGANDQNISQSSFHSVRFGGGNFVKTLSGDINLTGNLWIDDATLDVSASSYNISLDDYWHNDSTGSFLAHEATVTVTGEYNRIFTGATNTLYGAGQVVTQGGVKDFYNLTINATNEDYWMFIHGNLVVKNNFEITKGRFYQSYDANNYGINDIYVGGNFINHGSIYSNNYGEKIELNPTAGNHIFDPGSSNNYGHIYFNGTAGTSYTFESDLFLYDNRTITIENGDLFINSHKIETKNSGGNITLNGGAVNVNEDAIISVGNGATFTNAGGIFQLIGIADKPASLIATAGNFNFLQTAGTIGAVNYRIEGTSGNGINISGGVIDAVNTFQNGSFSGGAGTAYLTASGIDLGGDRLIAGVTFNSGAVNNVQRTNGNGAMNFENAIGTLAGENYDIDNADPGTLINWTYPGAVYWDGNTDGDGDNTHWNDPLNWANDVVPDANSMVILDHNAVAGAYTVNLSTIADGVAKSIIINSGANQISLILNGQKLSVNQDVTIGINSVLTQTNPADEITVGGSWSNEGTFNEGTSTVIFNPTTGIHTITTLGAGDAFYNFTINGTGGSNVISSTLDIDGTVSLQGGTLNGGSNLITVAQNWNRTGGAVFNYETSTVNFDGTNQTINGGEFYNLITTNSGTKTASANIDINNNFTIGTGTVFDGGTSLIYVGDDWTNEVGNLGFIQTGSGTVIFDGEISDQNIGSSTTLPTTFNNVTISGTRTKYTRQNIKINGNLVITTAALFVVDGTIIDGAGAANSLNMSGGRIYVNGANNFPQNFEIINLSAGTVDYYANIDQTIYPTTYYELMVRRINAGNLTTKTIVGDITVNSSLYIYDDETLLDVDNHTINLWGGLNLWDNGRQIDWGPDGTLIHFGEYFTVDKDISNFNNVIKKNRGYFRVTYQDIDITGNFSVLEDAYLQQESVNISSTGVGKTFLLAATAYVYEYNPISTGKAFPVNFSIYDLHKDSRVYLRGSSDQEIYTVPTYGNLYINTDAEINIELDGNLDVDGDFRMYNDDPTLVDNGFNIKIAGAITDIRQYTPTGSTTMTFDGADQAIYDAGYGATIFDAKNIVFSGTGQKSLHYNVDDWYNISGNLTIDVGVTVYLPRRLDFSGSNWTNNGIFNHTSYVVNFIGTVAQSINPGLNNDFYAVSFSNAGTKTFVNNGINVNNGTFTIENGTTVNMGNAADNLTHYIASERISNNGGNWLTSDANFVWDRNGTQYIPAMTAKVFTFDRYDQWSRVRYLEGAINISDLNIKEGTQLRCSQDAESNTPTYNVTMTGNFTNDGVLYAWGNTFAFESDDNSPKTIKQGDGNFDYVTFNQTMIGQNTRTYTLLEETRFYEDMVIGANATLDLNGQILRLGNDDPNDPVEPAAEQHTVQANGTLDVDAGASLIFSCRDFGNPILDVYGTLKIVGTNGNNANITSSDWHSNSHRIDININNGASVFAQYYLVKYLVDEGMYIDVNAIINPVDNFSNGTWSDLNTSTSGSQYYLECNADVTSIGTVDNVSFSFNGTPSVGHHFNVKRAAGSTGILLFDGNSSGLLAGKTYEADPVGENNSASSLIGWPIPSEVYWTGDISTDWFDANNWSPTMVPTNLTNAIIPVRSNNPIITGQDADCKDLVITTGYLTMQSGYDLDVFGDVYIGTGASVGILAIEDAGCEITVSGNWTRGQNALFVHGNGTVNFNAGGGSISIDPKSSEFGNINFNGGASFMITGNEIFVDNDFIITNGTVQPIANNYKLHIKGNYNNIAGLFDKTTAGIVYFDGLNNQTITNADLWAVTIDGAANKTTAGTCIIDGNLIVKNATLVGGCSIDMNNYVTIEAAGTFNDGGFTHAFSGFRWTGTGGYSGAGVVEFDRDNYQYINGAKFNDLVLKNNGGVSLENDVTTTGNLTLIEPNTYLSVQTYQIDNITGTGIFSMAENRRIYVRGANNFPAGFSSYDFDKSSYSIYDGTMTQTIAPVPVTYGRLYLDNSDKIMGGHLDINSILYFYDDASLDVTSNNYRINIEGDWDNYYDATFIPHEGEVIFDGDDQTTYLRIYNSGTNNPFYKLTVNKNNSTLYSLWTDIVVQNNLRVLNGVLYQNQTMYVGGDMTALSGTFANAGTYYLNKVSGISNLLLNNSVIANLTINSGATYYLQDALQMDGSFNLIAGTFEGNGKHVRMGNYGEVHEISGIYNIDAGGILQLPDYATLKVNSGGEIYVVGDAFNVATVTGYNGGRYYFNIENGGTIRALNYLFEYMAEAGIYVKNGGIIDPAFNFSYGTFTNPVAGGTCLRVENNQSFTDAASNPIAEVSFPYNAGGGARNVTKIISVGGVLDFKNYSGDFAGEDFDNDPDDLVNWISPPYVMWTGNIDNDWYKIGNWEVNFGPDRIPLITDNVIITQRTNQPIIDHDDAVAKTIDVRQNAILTLKTSAATDTTLEVAKDVFFNGTIVMTSANDKLTVGGNWSNSGIFIAGQGTVVFNSVEGTKSIDNLNDYFYNLEINTLSAIQLSRNLTVNNNFSIINGNFDLTSSHKILTVKGNFENNDVFSANNGKLVLAGTNPVQIFNPGSSEYYNIDISANAATIVNLSINELVLKHNLNINSGTFSLNNNSFKMGDGSGTDVITIDGGVLDIDENAILKMGNNSSIEVNNLGIISIVGSDIDHPAYLQSQSGYFSLNVNSGGTINAQFYNIMNTDINGIKINEGAIIDPVNNFSYGVWRNGFPSGQYLWLQNDFADFTAKNVYFHGGAAVNVKRLSGSGIITFEDALGSVAGENFENDNPAHGANTGLVRWVDTHNKYIWVGSVSSNWNDPNNWNVSAPHLVPTSADIALIPDIDEVDHWNPIISLGADATCYDLIVEDGGFLTIENNKNLDVTNSLVVANGAVLNVSTGSVSNIEVADIYIMEGTFNHGNSSTVIFDAPAGKILAISSASNFWNLTISSIGIAEYSTGTSLHIDGTFNIQQGIFSVSIPSDKIYVGKDWINSATFNHGNGKVIFNGNNQAITNSGNGNFYDLNFEGTGTKSLSSDVVVEHDVLIKCYSTFSALNFTFTLYGDWTNRGTFIPGTSTVNLVGNSPQLINNYNPEAFYNFSLNNTATAYPQVILYSDLRLLTNSTWSMIDGIFETSLTEMLYVEDNVTLVGGNTDASYVSGPITKIGDDDFIFPIGEGSVFARLGLDIDNSGSATFVAQYHSKSYFDIVNYLLPLNHVSGSEYWSLDRISGAEEPVLTFYWEDGARSGIDKLFSLTTALYVTDKWEDRAGNPSITGTIASGTITTGSAITTFGACGFGSYDTDNPLNCYNLWTGEISTQWNNPNNWTIGVPNFLINSLITDKPINQPIIDCDATAAQLIVGQGAHLTINPLKSLTVGGKLFINGDLTLKSDENGNAVLINNSTISYGTNCNVLTELYLTGFEYHHVSTPTTNAHTNIFKVDPVTPNFNPNFYWYDETDLDPDWIATAWHQYDGNMTVMDGYTTYFDRNPTILFDRSTCGDFNTGDFSKSLTYTGISAAPVIHRGWNFVGNPYPANLNWDDPGWTKTNIYNSIYFWNGVNYSYYVSSGTAQDNSIGTNDGTNIIPSMQGYFVKVIEGADPVQNQTGALITPASARTTTSQAFWKNNAANEIDVLRLTVVANGYSDETAISFNPNSTDNFDSYYDAFKLFTSTPSVPQIYSFIDDLSTACAINSVPDIYNERIIHVGFKATNNGDFTITVNDFQLSEYHDVYFEDTYTDQTYDLHNLDYTFSSEIGQFDDRFIIKFRENSTQTQVVNNQPNVQIYNYGDYLFLSSEIDDAVVGKIELINAVGQTIMLTENDNLYYAKIPLNCSNGIYIVRLTNKYGMVTSKIIVNR